MGILDAPGLSPATAAATFAPISALRRQGWAFIASNPNGLNSTRVVTAGATISYRSEHYAACAASSLRLVFANWYNASGVGGAPNNNPILVKASIERLSPLGPNTEDQPRIPITFGGFRYKTIDGLSVAVSDAAAFKVAAGERFFVRTAVSASVFGNSPAAPALGASTTGGVMPTGQLYQVALSYVFPTYETVMGAATQTAATGAGSANQVTVTAPTAVPGALGYRVWMTANGGSAASTFYCVSPVVSFAFPFAALYVPNVNGPTQNNQVGFPTGLLLQGGSSFNQGVDNGEGYNSGNDLVDTGYGALMNHGVISGYSPIAIMGSVVGKLPPSPVIIGDSIQAGRGDDGIGGPTRGGSAYRALSGITTTAITSSYVPAPTYGFMSAGPIPGERLSNFIDSPNGVPRQIASMLGSTVINNYATNDLPSGAALVMTRIVKLANLYVPAGIKLIQETVPPETTSTDGFRTVANQTLLPSYAAPRLIVNSWLRSTVTTTTVVTGEQAVIGGTTPGVGDGTNRAFQPSKPFVVGSETVSINGTPTTAYTYSTTAQLPNGSKCAGDIVLTSAPTTGAVVTFTYTAIPGFVAACAPAGSGLVDIFDLCVPVEVNSAGTLTLNGGYWLPAPAGQLDTGTITSATSLAINDTSKSWTPSGGAALGQKGVCVHILTDATTPASVGQVACIAANSATQLVILSANLSPVPSAGATYELYRPYTVDGIHPSSDGYRLMAAQVDLSKII